MKFKNYKEEIGAPEGVSLKKEGDFLIVSKGEVVIKRSFNDPRLKISVNDNKLYVEAETMTKKEKMQIGTFVAHIKNMIKGVEHPHVYKLRVCSGHFPMNLSITGKNFTVKNFIGEKVPRVLKLKEGVEVKIEGMDITVSSPDKELAGQTAGAIELLCRRPGFDSRIFQQGIYIIEKSGKPVV